MGLRLNYNQIISENFLKDILGLQEEGMMAGANTTLASTGLNSGIFNTVVTPGSEPVLGGAYAKRINAGPTVKPKNYRKKNDDTLEESKKESDELLDKSKMSKTERDIFIKETENGRRLKTKVIPDKTKYDRNKDKKKSLNESSESLRKEFINLSNKVKKELKQELDKNENKKMYVINMENDDVNYYDVIAKINGKYYSASLEESDWVKKKAPKDITKSFSKWRNNSKNFDNLPIAKELCKGYREYTGNSYTFPEYPKETIKTLHERLFKKPVIRDNVETFKWETDKGDNWRVEFDQNDEEKKFPKEVKMSAKEIRKRHDAQELEAQPKRNAQMKNLQNKRLSSMEKIDN